MSAPEKITESMAQWLVDQTFAGLPKECIEKAIDVTYDLIGGMIACSTLPEVRAVVHLVAEQGSRPECTIIGHSVLASVVNAAMANGGMAHGNEVDPVHMTSVGGHVAAGPVPTALTVGEWLDAPGEEVLRAIVLGYELGGRLMTIFYRDRDYVVRRFYHTAIAANVTSAVTAALLFELTAKLFR